MAQTLPRGTYCMDDVMWGKVTNSSGQEEIVPFFPFTRYENVLGRPKVIKNVVDAFPTDLALLKVKEEEMDDGIIYDKAGQEW